MITNSTHGTMSPARALAATLSLLALLVCAAAPVRAETFPVTDTADTFDGVCDAHCTLREAISAANSQGGPDTIVFSKNIIPGIIALASVLPDLTDDVTISGPGAAQMTVSGGGSYRIFRTGSGKSLAVSGLTLRDGKAPSSSSQGGGAILGWGPMTLTDCILSHNTAPNGGAIDTRVSLTITRCTLSDNSSTQHGGAINLGAGSLTLHDSTFNENSSGSNGGAIVLLGGTSVVATNCVFSGNQATSACIQGGTVTLTNSTISGNTAYGLVGAIEPADSLTLNNCTISNNTGTSYGSIRTNKPLTLTNCSISGNTATGSGGTGGVYSYATGSIVTALINCTISGNTGYGAYGGGFLKTNGTATVTNCTISGNSINGAVSYGGGIAATGSALLTVTNCTISNNNATASAGGWGAFIQGSSVLYLRSSIVAGNSPAGNPEVLGTVNINIDNRIGGTAAEAGLEVDGSGKPMLKNNGGPTKTIALLPGSPAIDAVQSAFYAATDQRGITRPQDGDGDGVAFPDIGAYEKEHPTLVELVYFKAAHSEGTVGLSWQTASEVDNAGFHLWRSKKRNGKYIRISDEIIPAEGSAFTGAAYSFEDPDVEPRRAYFYKLEDIDANGVSTFHGPAEATKKKKISSR